MVELGESWPWGLNCNLSPDIRMFLRVVDENTDLLGPDLLCPVSEDEEHRVDDVRFAAPVWSDDRSEAFVKRAQHLK